MSKQFEGQGAFINGITLSREAPAWPDARISDYSRLEVNFSLYKGNNLVQAALALIAMAVDMDRKAHTDLVRVARELGEGLAAIGLPADELRSMGS